MLLSTASRGSGNVIAIARSSENIQKYEYKTLVRCYSLSKWYVEFVTVLVITSNVIYYCLIIAGTLLTIDKLYLTRPFHFVLTLPLSAFLLTHIFIA